MEIEYGEGTDVLTWLQGGDDFVFLNLKWNSLDNDKV